MKTKQQPQNEPRPELTDADRSWRRFVLFRVLFNSRFYYPVLAVLFLDLGVSATEYTLLNFAGALGIFFTDFPAGVWADRIGRKPLVVAAAVFMVACENPGCVPPMSRLGPETRLSPKPQLGVL